MCVCTANADYLVTVHETLVLSEIVEHTMVAPLRIYKLLDFLATGGVFGCLQLITKQDGNKCT